MDLNQYDQDETDEDGQISPTQERVRNIILAIISAILLLIFIIPMLMNLFRSIQPPPPVIPTENSGPSA